VRADENFDPADQRILQSAAMVTALRLLTERSVSEAEYQVCGELLTDLLDVADRQDPDTAALRERARRLKADLDVAHVVVVAKAEDADRRRLASAAAHLAATGQGLAGERAGTIVLLPPGIDPTATARDVLHVHVNTVTQRLDRIAKLLGPGWNFPDRALELQLALRLHRLR
jgi:sugar diacid utilization regulator